MNTYNQTHTELKPLSYTVDMYGVKKNIVLPFVVGIFSNLSGDQSEKSTIGDRKFREIDAYNFDLIMERINPKLNLQISDLIDVNTSEIPLTLRFGSMRDFEPEGIVKQVMSLKKLQTFREQLEKISLRLEVKPELANELAAIAYTLKHNANDECDIYENKQAIEKLSSLLWTGADVAEILVTLNHKIVRRHLFSDVPIETVIGRASEDVDGLMSSQLSLIMHHPKFQELESAWRGINYLVNNTTNCNRVKIRVMDISKHEMSKTVRKQGAMWDASPIFKELYSNQYGCFGGEPYGLIICDYYCNHENDDTRLLEFLQKIGRACAAPIVIGTLPSLFFMDSWDELSKPRYLSQIFSSADYVKWRSLRENKDSRHLIMTLPRLLARRIWNDKTYNYNHSFKFRESITKKTDVVWMNGVFGLALVIMNAFARNYWFSDIGDADCGRIASIPVQYEKISNEIIDEFNCTEIDISFQRLRELGALGFTSLIQNKNDGFATIFAPTVLKSIVEFDNIDEAKAARLRQRLEHILCINRIVCVLGAFLRDTQYKNQSNEWSCELEGIIKDWLSDYIVRENNQKAIGLCSLIKIEFDIAEGKQGGLREFIHIKLFFDYGDQLGKIQESIRLSYSTEPRVFLL